MLLSAPTSCSCLDTIQRIEWAPDSCYVLCALCKPKAIVQVCFTTSTCGMACLAYSKQVWSVSDTSWSCKIDEGVAGLSYARWTPDSRHVITVSDFCVRLTVWSLINRSRTFIKFPKLASQGCSFCCLPIVNHYKVYHLQKMVLTWLLQSGENAVILYKFIIVLYGSLLKWRL